MTALAAIRAAGSAPVRDAHSEPIANLPQDARDKAQLVMINYVHPDPLARPRHVQGAALDLDAFAGAGFSPQQRRVVDADFSAYVGAGRVDVSIRGTSNWDHLVTDLKLVAGCPWSQLHTLPEFQLAIDAVEAVLDKYPAKDVYVHGHSLGATKAMVVAVHLGGRGVRGGHLFNPGAGIIGFKEYAAIGATFVMPPLALTASAAAAAAAESAAVAASAATTTSSAATAAAASVAAAADCWAALTPSAVAPTAVTAAIAATTVAQAAAAHATAAATAAASAAATAKAAAVAAASAAVTAAAALGTDDQQALAAGGIQVHHIFGDGLSCNFPFTDLMTTYTGVGGICHPLDSHALRSFL